MSNSVYMRPDWVILGVDNPPNGVFIIASSDLTVAELRAVRDEWSEWPPNDGLFVRATSSVYELETTMRRYVWIQGTTYADAIRRLFEQWTPDQARRVAIGDQPGLPSPPT